MSCSLRDAIRCLRFTDRKHVSHRIKMLKQFSEETCSSETDKQQDAKKWKCVVDDALTIESLQTGEIFHVKYIICCKF